MPSSSKSNPSDNRHGRREKREQQLPSLSESPSLNSNSQKHSHGKMRIGLLPFAFKSPFTRGGRNTPQPKEESSSSRLLQERSDSKLSEEKEHGQLDTSVSTTSRKSGTRGIGNTNAIQMVQHLQALEVVPPSRPRTPMTKPIPNAPRNPSVQMYEPHPPPPPPLSQSSLRSDASEPAAVVPVNMARFRTRTPTYHNDKPVMQTSPPSGFSISDSVLRPSQVPRSPSHSSSSLGTDESDSEHRRYNYSSSSASSPNSLFEVLHPDIQRKLSKRIRQRIRNRTAQFSLLEDEQLHQDKLPLRDRKRQSKEVQEQCEEAEEVLERLDHNIFDDEGERERPMKAHYLPQYQTAAMDSNIFSQGWMAMKGEPESPMHPAHPSRAAQVPSRSQSFMGQRSYNLSCAILGSSSISSAFPPRYLSPHPDSQARLQPKGSIQSNFNRPDKRSRLSAVRVSFPDDGDNCYSPSGYSIPPEQYESQTFTGSDRLHPHGRNVDVSNLRTNSMENTGGHDRPSRLSICSSFSESCHSTPHRSPMTPSAAITPFRHRYLRGTSHGPEYHDSILRTPNTPPSPYNIPLSQRPSTNTRGYDSNNRHAYPAREAVGQGTEGTPDVVGGLGGVALVTPQNYANDNAYDTRSYSVGTSNSSQSYYLPTMSASAVVRERLASEVHDGKSPTKKAHLSAPQMDCTPGRHIPPNPPVPARRYRTIKTSPQLRARNEDANAHDSSTTTLPSESHYLRYSPQQRGTPSQSRQSPTITAQQPGSILNSPSQAFTSKSPPKPTETSPTVGASLHHSEPALPPPHIVLSPSLAAAISHGCEIKAVTTTESYTVQLRHPSVPRRESPPHNTDAHHGHAVSEHFLQVPIRGVDAGGGEDSDVDKSAGSDHTAAPKEAAERQRRRKKLVNSPGQVTDPVVRKKRASQSRSPAPKNARHPNGADYSPERSQKNPSRDATPNQNSEPSSTGKPARQTRKSLQRSSGCQDDSLPADVQCGVSTEETSGVHANDTCAKKKLGSSDGGMTPSPNTIGLDVRATHEKKKAVRVRNKSPRAMRRRRRTSNTVQAENEPAPAPPAPAPAPPPALPLWSLPAGHKPTLQTFKQLKPSTAAAKPTTKEVNIEVKRRPRKTEDGPAGKSRSENSSISSWSAFTSAASSLSSWETDSAASGDDGEKRSRTRDSRRSRSNKGARWMTFANRSHLPQSADQLLQFLKTISLPPRGRHVMWDTMDRCAQQAREERVKQAAAKERELQESKQAAADAAAAVAENMEKAQPTQIEEHQVEARSESKWIPGKRTSNSRGPTVETVPTTVDSAEVPNTVEKSTTEEKPQVAERRVSTREVPPQTAQEVKRENTTHREHHHRQDANNTHSVERTSVPPRKDHRAVTQRIVMRNANQPVSPPESNVSADNDSASARCKKVSDQSSNLAIPSSNDPRTLTSNVLTTSVQTAALTAPHSYTFEEGEGKQVDPNLIGFAHPPYAAKENDDGSSHSSHKMFRRFSNLRPEGENVVHIYNDSPIHRMSTSTTTTAKMIPGAIPRAAGRRSKEEKINTANPSSNDPSIATPTAVNASKTSIVHLNGSSHSEKTPSIASSYYLVLENISNTTN